MPLLKRAREKKIYDLQNDFEKINVVIAAQSQAMQNTLCKIWFPLKLLANISNHRQDAVINFSIDQARKASWASAVALALVQGEARDNYISMMDDSVVRIADRIINPPFFTGLLLKLVLMMESKNVSKMIDELSS